MRKEAVLVVSGLAVGFGLGLWAGYAKTRPILETYKPEVRQSDGSLILERKPDPDAKPKQKIPFGASVDRVVSVQVETLEPVKAVSVDFTLISLPDGSKRVVASSPDGTVIGGGDFVVAGAIKPLKWSAGVLYAKDGRYGGFVQYQNRAFVAQTVAVGGNVYLGFGVRF